MIAIIPDDLLALAVPIDTLHNDPANARKGHDVDGIAASLAQYGQPKPIVVNRAENNKIVAGNGTWRAAKQLGWTHIAAVMVDWNPQTAVGFGIADNRLSDLSEWDNDTLATLLQSLDLDAVVTGFDNDDLSELLADIGVPNFEPVDESEQPRLDKKSPVICPHCGMNIHDEPED